MRKIDGEIIQRAVEIGVKYVADDGREFDNIWECKQYEARMKQEERNKHFLAVYHSLMKSKLIEGNASTDERSYVKQFETKEEFIDTYNTLDGYHYDCTNHYTSYNDSFTYLKEEFLPEFPANFVIEFSLVEHETSSDTESFHFIEANEYIKKLQDKIDVVKEAIK